MKFLVRVELIESRYILLFMVMYRDQDVRSRIRHNWSAGGIAFLCLGLIVCALIVSSLVVDKFDLQGFILGVIDVYRIPFDYVVDFLDEKWGLSVKRSTVEMFLLNSLLAASFWMALDLFYKASFMRLALLVAFVTFITVLDYHDWSFYNAPRAENLPYYLYAVLFASLFASGFLLPSFTEQARHTATVHRLAAGYMMSIVVLFGVVAVLSEGLAGLGR